MKSAPMARIVLRGERPGRPPLVRLQLDVTLRNPADRARWFLIPTKAPGATVPPAPGDGGVDVLEVSTVGATAAGKGRAVVGRFLGNGGFTAVKLPAGGEVTLRGYPLGYWGDPPATLTVDVASAAALTIGGQPAESWFGIDPTSDPHAEGAVEGAPSLSVHRSTDGKEVSVTADDVSRATIAVEHAP